MQQLGCKHLARHITLNEALQTTIGLTVGKLVVLQHAAYTQLLCQLQLAAAFRTPRGVDQLHDAAVGGTVPFFTLQ